jgi:hypothetical protein
MTPAADLFGLIYLSKPTIFGLAKLFGAETIRKVKRNRSSEPGSP